MKTWSYDWRGRSLACGVYAYQESGARMSGGFPNFFRMALITLSMVGWPINLASILRLPGKSSIEIPISIVSNALPRQKQHQKAGKHKHRTDDIFHNMTGIPGERDGDPPSKVEGREYRNSPPADRTRMNGIAISVPIKNMSGKRRQPDQRFGGDILLNRRKQPVHALGILACDLGALKATSGHRRVYCAIPWRL